MVDDVQKITGLIHDVKPLAAARLCNFRTGDATPLDAHIAWINGELKSALASSPNPWVDIYAYASQRGGSRGFDNQALSEHRRGAIHNAILTAVPRTGLIKQDAAFGASRSTGDANDNSGYWRAVEVYAYGGLPGKREPDPVKPPTPPKPKPNPAQIATPDWWVTSLSVGGLSIIATVGGGFVDGTIGFENIAIGGEVITDSITMGGPSIGESAGLDKLDKVAKLLKESAIAAKVLNWIANNAGAGIGAWPSWANGPVFAMPGRSNLTGADFRGTCFSVFVNAALGPGSSGFYLVFLGKQESLPAFLAWIAASLAVPVVVPAMMASNIMANSHAVAVIPAASFGLGASLGVSLNIWVGRIS